MSFTTTLCVVISSFVRYIIINTALSQSYVIKWPEHLLIIFFSEDAPPQDFLSCTFSRPRPTTVCPWEFHDVQVCLSLRLCSPVKRKATPHSQHSGPQKLPFCSSPSDELIIDELQIFPSPVCLNGDLEVSCPQSFLKVRKVFSLVLFCFLPYAFRLRSRKSVFLAPYCWLQSISLPPTWNCSLLPLPWTCHFLDLFWLLFIQGIGEPWSPCSSSPQPCHHSMTSALTGDPPYTLTSQFPNPSLPLSHPPSWGPLYLCSQHQ